MRADRADKGFWKDTALVAASNLIVKSRTLITIPLITWNLGLPGLGAWSQVWAAANLIAAVAPFNVHVFMIRQVASGAEGSQAAYSSAVAFAAVTGVLVVAAMSLASSTAGALIFGNSGFADIAVLTGLLALAVAIRGVALNQYRAHARFLRRSAFELLAALLEILVLIAGWQAGLPLHTLVLLLVVMSLSIALVAAVDVLRFSGLHRPSLTFVREALKYGVPLLPLTLSAWVLDRIDRFFISHHLGLDAVGEYSAVYSLAGVVLIFQAPVQMTLFPKISQLWGRDSPQALRLVEKCLLVLVSLSIATGAILSVTATEALRLLVPGARTPDFSLICAAISLGLCAYSVFSVTGLVLHAQSKTRLLGISSIVAACVNCGLNVWLIPQFGLLGAAIATTISYSVSAALLSHLTRSNLAWSKISVPLGIICVSVAPGVCIRYALGGTLQSSILAAATVSMGALGGGLIAWKLGLLKRWF